jgi:hypothetical protein
LAPTTRIFFFNGLTSYAICSRYEVACENCWISIGGPSPFASAAGIYGYSGTGKFEDEGILFRVCSCNSWCCSCVVPVDFPQNAD